ncbi:MAG: prenyltransferase/squalene oxidase repeat-containing protein, partial [Pirellulaceae bacterium]|nr:prenyltransferase/squalene oxidase repeat-containing protein [Pirellulaceae bacterium]
DTDLSYSNVATTMLAVAALHLSGNADRHRELIAAGDAYVDRAGRLDALRARYGKDKTFAVPILTNCALAELALWSDVSSLPFELACFPQSFYRFLRLPVVSYAIPALVAVGQVKFAHQKPWFPPLRWIRAAAVAPSLRVLERIQPASGGYLEAVPLTSFVVMSLVGAGQVDNEVVSAGVRFLRESVRADGSWPIDTNLATWNTSLSLSALAGGGDDLASLPDAELTMEWLLDCQNTERHPFTGADPGGWGWTNLSGAVPDADDTPAALLALASWRDGASCGEAGKQRMRDAAACGADWLLKLQNRDGGWPTFCRGWGKLPFDRSGADLTAHALRAFHAWQSEMPPALARRAGRAAARGWRYLERRQAADGSWQPLWFGNQDHPKEENPIYGTAKTLMAYRDCGKTNTLAAQRGFNWLATNQNADGGWGGGVSADPERRQVVSSTEETALAVEALLASPADTDFTVALERGLLHLVELAESGGHRVRSPIGFYFAKLWYHERLYPLIYSVSALGRAIRRRVD